MKKYILLLTTIIILFSLSQVAQATAWPGSSTTGTSVATETTLGASYEPSGLTWNGTQLVMVGDDGNVTTMSRTGSDITTVNPGGDLEGVAIIDPTSNLVYVGIERPDSIAEFDLITGLTGKSWDLTAWMNSADENLGLEALTFVPNADLPSEYGTSVSGGFFYAGLQSNANIYVFNVDTSVDGTTPTLIATLAPPTGITSDIADLNYNADTQTLYAIYDGNNVLAELTTAGTLVNSYELPGDNQEGLAVIPDCDTNLATIIIGEDVNSDSTSGTRNYDPTPDVWSYSGYPITCIIDEPADDDTEDPPVDDGTGDDTEDPPVNDTAAEECDDVTETATDTTSDPAPPTATDPVTTATPTATDPVTTAAPTPTATEPATTTVETQTDTTPVIEDISKNNHSIVITYSDDSEVSFRPFGKRTFAAELDQRGQRIIATSGKRVRVYDNCGELLTQRVIHKKRANRLDVLLLPTNGKAYRTIIVATGKGKLAMLRLTASDRLTKLDRASITPSTTKVTPRLKSTSAARRFTVKFKNQTRWQVGKGGQLQQL